MRAAILHGQFEPGRRLIERELCESLQVSRTSVREALRQLEAEGLVKVLPYRGPVVTTLTTAEAQQIYSVREVLEGLAGRGFVDHATKEQHERLREAYKNLTVAAREKRFGAILELKEQFYRILLEGCANLYARDMLQQLNNRVRLLRAASLSDTNRPPQTMREMKKIMDAIESGDRQRTWDACAEHVRNAAAVAFAVLTKAETAAFAGSAELNGSRGSNGANGLGAAAPSTAPTRASRANGKRQSTHRT
jgi:DNA-binding GntR family transcriptional regulator